MNLLGIDIGTSGCKAAIYNERGDLMAESRRSYEVVFSEGGGAELNSVEVISKCFESIRECTGLVEHGSVKALSISSQGEAFTAVGANRDILSNAMISSDTRSAPFIEPLLDAIGEEKLYEITGHTAQPIFTVFKLLWFKKNKTEIWSNARYFLCFEDLLQLFLGIEPTISWSLAGRTMLFDVRKHEWSSDILSEIGLDPLRLATPLQSGSIAGTVSSRVSSELGLSKDTLIVNGGHDQACNALGAGVTKEGVAMLATGTVECITAAFKKPIFNEQLRENNLCTYDYVVPDSYSSIAYHLTGGNILSWFADEFGYPEKEKANKTGEDYYSLLLDQIRLEPSDLLVLPYFTTSGTPYFDRKTKGTIYGLRLTTKRHEILQALLEGVAYEMRLNLEILDSSGYQINKFRAVGGGARSAKWLQLKANILGRDIDMINTKETGCYGASILAFSAISKRSSIHITNDWVKTVKTLIPNQKYKKDYLSKLLSYKKLYKSLKEELNI
jgi:xylulokinase